MDEIIFPNGLTRTLILDDRPFDPGLEGCAVFSKALWGKWTFSQQWQ